MAGFQGNYIAPIGVTPIAGGGVGSGAIGPNSVLSGNIGSGQVGQFHLASGSVTSGAIASGQVGRFALSSGSVQGALGTTPVLASGTIGTNDLASGVAAPANSSGTIVRAAQFVTPFQSGTSWSLLTEEIISGVRAVMVSQSGQLRVAMASVSGRMPAIGIVADGVLSGIPANVYTQGMFQLSSGLADYSGCLGKPVWVGRSGHVVSWSGSFNSGGLNVLSGGDFVQRIGVAVTSGGFVVNVMGDVGQTQLLGVTAITDVENRAFGV